MVIDMLLALGGYGIGYEVVRVWLILTLGKLIRSQWKVTDGKVLSYSTLTSTGAKHSPSRRANRVICDDVSMCVEYCVGESTYNTKRVNLWDFVSPGSNYDTTLKTSIDEEIYRRGFVSVYYQPGKPSNAVVRPFAGKKLGLQVGIMAVLVVLTWLVYLFYQGAPGVRTWTSAASIACYGTVAGVIGGGWKLYVVFRALQRA